MKTVTWFNAWPFTRTTGYDCIFAFPTTVAIMRFFKQMENERWIHMKEVWMEKMREDNGKLSYEE